jgi:hypothetical protein
MYPLHALYQHFAGLLLRLHQGGMSTVDADFEIAATDEHESDEEYGEDESGDEWDDAGDVEMEHGRGPHPRWDKIFNLEKMKEIVEKHRRGVSMQTICHDYRNLPKDDRKHFNVLMHRYYYQ